MNIEIELENEEELILPEHWGNRRNIENEEPVNENIIVVIPNIIWSKFKNNNNRDLLKIISGFDFDEFNDLFSKVKKKFRQKGRGGRRGGIRNYKQMPGNKTIFLLTLSWLRNYDKYEILSTNFGISKAWCHDLVVDTIFKCHDILVHDQIYWIGFKKQKEENSLFVNFPTVVAVIDCTVHRINKPKRRQKSCSGLVMHYVTGVNGRKHDKKIFDRSYPGEIENFFHKENEESQIEEPLDLMVDKG
ncbi:hypothetical protein M0812_04976 [Anaeramoeba flamelloides]|uniref:DDE Tnp4 domain-containing protein n=1 Tax=Anaeramoeba flamelloides TaxID=1746091 RepID=A0AAV8AAI6_9EUKA|nr:hypothetical protein M0812_04976 [Anaeramoeba flamelloides]